MDVAIVGAGVAGLWLRARLVAEGYRVLTIERTAIGGGQTQYAQGIVHGGLKYALGAQITTATRAIAGMPARWRQHLQGDVLPSLAGLPLLSDAYYLLANAGLTDRLKGFFASKALHGTVQRVTGEARPTYLQHREFRGDVYRLEDFVIEPRQLAEWLARAVDAPLLHAAVTGAQPKADHVVLRLSSVGDTPRAELTASARWLILCAGAGNAELLTQLGQSAPSMQRRPLHQVWLRGQRWPELYAHCLASGVTVEPRLTLVRHHSDGGDVLSIGGALATGGVGRSAAAQAEFARREVAACLPWLSLAGVEVGCAEIDRAEPLQSHGVRPDDAYVHTAGPVVTCWPTKLSLTPVLADHVLRHLTSSGSRLLEGRLPDEITDWPAPPLAAPPWESLQWN